MIVAITGTPGTGKTSVANILRKKDYKVIDLNKVALKNNFLQGVDERRDTKIVDIDALDEYVKKNIKTKDIVFIESHLSHLLKCINKVVVLRCRPKELMNRLSEKGWNNDKIGENIDAEILDVILCEAVDLHDEGNVFEIDTTDKTISKVSSSIVEMVDSEFRDIKKYKVGSVDWSDEIFKRFENR